MQDCVRLYWDYKSESSSGRFPSQALTTPTTPDQNWVKLKEWNRRKRAIAAPSGGWRRVKREKKESVIAQCIVLSNRDKMNYVLLDIMFPNLRYTEVTQESSWTFTKFVSDIGGLVGLWIGASIITMTRSNSHLVTVRERKI